MRTARLATLRIALIVSRELFGENVRAEKPKARPQPGFLKTAVERSYFTADNRALNLDL